MSPARPRRAGEALTTQPALVRLPPPKQAPHCRSCSCFGITQEELDSRTLLSLLAQDALAAVLRWWRESRSSARCRTKRRQPRLRLTLVAYPGDIAVLVREVKVKAFRKGK